MSGAAGATAGHRAVSVLYQALLIGCARTSLVLLHELARRPIGRGSDVLEPTEEGLAVRQEPLAPGGSRATADISARP